MTELSINKGHPKYFAKVVESDCVTNYRVNASFAAGSKILGAVTSLNVRLLSNRNLQSRPNASSAFHSAFANLTLHHDPKRIITLHYLSSFTDNDTRFRIQWQQLATFT